jgi:hypothetical protein
MILRFTDGVNIDTSGPLRTVELEDGWYVVGEGMSIPCRDRMDAHNALRLMRGERRHLTTSPTVRGVLFGMVLAALALAVLVVVLSVTAPEAQGQVTAEAQLSNGVTEVQIGNPTPKLLSVSLSLFRDATQPGKPVALGDSVSALISPSAFTLNPGEIQTVRIRVRESVAPGELLRLASLFTPHEADALPSGQPGMRLLIKQRLITKVRAVQ